MKETAMNTVLISAAILGAACGLRAIIGLAAVSWAANSSCLTLEGTWLSFLGKSWTLYITSLLALGELADKLPKTLSRLVPTQFGVCLVMGGLGGAAIGISQGRLASGLIAGLIGSVIGTIAGFKGRALLARAFGLGLPAALLENVLAIVLAFLALR